jgi:RHS repeat-associated protein
VINTTNVAGSMLTARRYDAFGNLELGAGNGHGYVGREWDSEAQLYYYRARSYDPKIGRFLSEDPIGFYDDINLFAYVGNNPLRWKDPFGLHRATGHAGGGCSCRPSNPQEIVREAQSHTHAIKWGFLWWPPGVNKCNLFVAQVLRNVGLAIPNFYGDYPPRANDWGDPTTYIPCCPVASSPDPGKRDRHRQPEPEQVRSRRDHHWSETYDVGAEVVCD